MRAMPYKKFSDVNPSVRGIKPKVTLAQANKIAEWADAITEGDNAKGAWAIAISQFKKLYTVRGGKWVERASLEKQKEAEQETMTKITIDVEDSVQLGGKKLLVPTVQASEAAMKTVGGEKFIV